MTIRGGAGAIDRRSPPPHKMRRIPTSLSCKKVSFFLYKRAALPYLAKKRGERAQVAEINAAKGVDCK